MEETCSRTEHEHGRVLIEMKIVKEEESHSIGESTANTLVEIHDEKSAKLSEANIRFNQLKNKERHQKIKKPNKHHGYISKHISNRRAGQSRGIPPSNHGKKNSDGSGRNCSDWQDFSRDRNCQNKRVPTTQLKQKSFVIRKTLQSWDNHGPNRRGDQNASQNHTDQQNFQSAENFQYRKPKDTNDTLSVQNNQCFCEQCDPGCKQIHQNAFVNRMSDQSEPSNHGNQNADKYCIDQRNFQYRKEQDNSQILSVENNVLFSQQSGSGNGEFQQNAFVNRSDQPCNKSEFSSRRNQYTSKNHVIRKNNENRNQEASGEKFCGQNNRHFPQQSGSVNGEFQKKSFVNRAYQSCNTSKSSNCGNQSAGINHVGSRNFWHRKQQDNSETSSTVQNNQCFCQQSGTGNRAFKQNAFVDKMSDQSEPSNHGNQNADKYCIDQRNFQYRKEQDNSQILSVESNVLFSQQSGSGNGEFQQNAFVNRSDQPCNKSEFSSRRNQYTSKNHVIRKNNENRNQEASGEKFCGQNNRHFPQQSGSVNGEFQKKSFVNRAYQSCNTSKSSNCGNQSAGINHVGSRNFWHRKQQDNSETSSTVQNNQCFCQQSGTGNRAFKQNAFVDKYQGTDFRNAPQETANTQFESENLRNRQPVDYEWYITVIKTLARSQYFWALVVVVKAAFYRFINRLTGQWLNQLNLKYE